MIKRRSLVLAPLPALCLPAWVHAQPRSHRIGILDRYLPIRTIHDTLVARLDALGYREGRNLAIERRILEARNLDQRPAVAAELAKLHLDLVVAPGDGAAQAMHAAQADLPIVMPWSIDPVGGGLARSLARPGGSLTGLTITAHEEQYARSLQLFKEALPALKQLSLLWDPTIRGQEKIVETINRASRSLGVQVDWVPVRTPSELLPALEAEAARKTQALWMGGGPAMDPVAKVAADFAIARGLPAFASFTGYVVQGCLMAYSVNVPELYGRAATFVDRILKGAKPGDLPIERPTVFELAINQKTADAIRLRMPQSILLQAERVIG